MPAATWPGIVQAGEDVGESAGFVCGGEVADVVRVSADLGLRTPVLLMLVSRSLSILGRCVDSFDCCCGIEGEQRGSLLPGHNRRGHDTLG